MPLQARKHAAVAGRSCGVSGAAVAALGLLMSACVVTPPSPPQGGGPEPVNGAESETGAPSPLSGKTAQEQMDAIDQAFGESLGVFDERLSREQTAQQEQREAAAADRAAREAAGGRGGEEDGNGGRGAPPPSGGGFGDDNEPADGDPRGGPASPGNRAGPTPPDVGDGRDDDIVARQLREAAQRETDPELRERLWDEYREYKRSL